MEWLSWIGTWVTSPGFGGTAAVVAAWVAWATAKRNRESADARARADREAEDQRSRQTQWWSQSQWAVDMVIRGEPASISVGSAALTSLIDEAPSPDAQRFAQAALTHALFVAESAEGKMSDSSPRRRLRRRAD